MFCIVAIWVQIPYGFWIVDIQHSPSFKAEHERVVQSNCNYYQPLYPQTLSLTNINEDTNFHSSPTEEGQNESGLAGLNLQSVLYIHERATPIDAT